MKKFFLVIFLTLNLPAVSIANTVEQLVSRELGDGLREINIEEMAKKILYVQKSMSEDYAVSDAVGFTLFILKCFSEMGNFELVQADIKKIIEIVVGLVEIDLTPEVSIILDQIEKVRFGQYEGKRSAVIFSVDGQSIDLPLNQKGEPGSSIKEVKSLHLKNGIRLQFKEMISTSDKNAVNDFLTEVVKVPLLPKDWFGALNQINNNMIKAYPVYRKNTEIAPLEVSFSGANILVDTRTILKEVDLNIEKAYYFPNMMRNEMRIPSLAIEIKNKILRLKISIDQ